MLIGGDDIKNGVTTLGACFYMFCNVCLHLHLFPLCADWWKFDSSVDVACVQTSLISFVARGKGTSA